MISEDRLGGRHLNASTMDDDVTLLLAVAKHWRLNSSLPRQSCCGGVSLTLCWISLERIKSPFNLAAGPHLQAFVSDGSM